MIHFEWRLFMQLSKVMVTTKAWLYIFHHFHWVQCCYFSWNKISNEISYFFWFFFSLLFLIESEPISTSYTSVFRETCDDVIIENKRSHDDMIKWEHCWKLHWFQKIATFVIYIKGLTTCFGPPMIFEATWRSAP